jgi:hypothetical protein
MLQYNSVIFFLEYSCFPPTKTHHTLPILCRVTSEAPTWITLVHNSCVAVTIIVMISRVRWEIIKQQKIMNINFMLQNMLLA